WGLHEMHGNVLEWVADNYGPYPAIETDSSELVSDYGLLLRGGSWRSKPLDLRAGRRWRSNLYERIEDFGFRLARTLG
ncbi:MAG: formylglycine-generating enzyme family protein, partial [Alphaproteobacteria bacterium]